MNVPLLKMRIKQNALDYAFSALLIIGIVLFFIFVIVSSNIIISSNNPCFGINNCVVTTVHTGSQITKTVYQP